MLLLVGGQWSSSAFTRMEKMEVAYVAANQTLREVYCRLRNTGVVDVTLTEVSVDGRVVTTGYPLPIRILPGNSYTYVFLYGGPWEGVIYISFHSQSGSEYPKTVDLQAASRNSIEEAFRGSSPAADPLTVWFESPKARDLISQARSRLREAQDAYRRGENDAAYRLAYQALFLLNQAVAAERSYQAEVGKTMLIALVIVGALVIAAMILVLWRRRG